MKKKRILWIIIAIFLVYTCCTYSGAMKLRAFLITKDLSVYMNSIHVSAFGKLYYVFKKQCLPMIQGMRLVFSNVTGILFLCMWNMSDFHKKTHCIVCLFVNLHMTLNNCGNHIRCQLRIIIAYDVLVIINHFDFLTCLG